MFFPGTLPFFPVSVHHSYCTTNVDFKASGEESEVPLWGYECRSTSNTAAQAKEEGRQDGLRLPWPGMAEQHHYGKGTFTYPRLICTAFLRSVPFHLFLSFTVWCCD